MRFPTSSLQSVLLVAAAASGLAAQVPQPQPQQQQGAPMPTSMPYTRTLNYNFEDGLQSIWRDRTTAPFQGFPTFPSSLGGYGEFPAPPKGLLAPPTYDPATLPPPIPAEPVAPDWPSWVRLRSNAPLPYQPDRALLIRSTDRVWFRTPSEDAFVPLYFFDTARTLEAGSEVRVPKIGEFMLHLHSGGVITSLGAAEMKVAKLEEKQVRIEITRFTKLLLQCGPCAHEFALPDGSLLQVPLFPPETGNAAELRLARADEPGWISGRAMIYNSGNAEVTWRTPFGDVALKPGEEVQLFLDPPANPLPAALQTDTMTDRAGGRLQCRASRDGQVTWSGARFQLPAGGVLEIDPLLGKPFTQPTTAR